MVQLGFFLTPIPWQGIKLMSVQLHLFWGTLIQDTLPTDAVPSCFNCFPPFTYSNRVFCYFSQNRAFCQICEYYACFAPSCTDKHEFFKGKSEVLPSLRDLIKDTVLKGRKRRKKPSTQGLSNPRPQELCYTGMCSSTVLQLLPRPALVFLGTCVLPYSLHMVQLEF